MKKRIKLAYLFPCLLLLSILLVTAFGYYVKATVGKDNDLVQDTMAVAVPFLILRGEISLVEEPVVLEPAYLPLQREVLRTPKFVAVEEDFFDTALFIGDSRTVGFDLYAQLGEADYFADVGMTVFNLFNTYMSERELSGYHLESLLTERDYETIYFMLGINEMPYAMSTYESQLNQVLDRIMALEPEATIVLEANLGVTATKEKNSPQFGLEKMTALNNIIAKVAEERGFLYIDVNPLFADEDGRFRGDYTGDGVHPYVKEYQSWSYWLLNFGIDYDEIVLDPIVPTIFSEDIGAENQENQ